MRATRSRQSWTPRGSGNAHACGSVTLSWVPTALLRGLGLVNPAIRELRETDYQFARPYLLDDSRTRSVLGLEPTPWATLLTDQGAIYR